MQLILEYNVYHVLLINLLSEPIHAPSMTAIKDLVGSWRGMNVVCKQKLTVLMIDGGCL